MPHINVVTALLLMGSVVQTLSGQQLDPTLEERARPYLAAALAAGNNFVSVSGRKRLSNLAPESLASACGPSLATRTETGTAPYPTSLGGISMQIVDSAGASRLAQLLYVSPTQINYLVPSGTAGGAATTNIVTVLAMCHLKRSRLKRSRRHYSLQMAMDRVSLQRRRIARLYRQLLRYLCQSFSATMAPSVA